MAVSVGASVGRRRANVLHSYDDRVTDADFTQCRRTIMRYNSSLIGSSAARSCAPVERCEFNRRQVEVPACVCLCVCVCPTTDKFVTFLSSRRRTRFALSTRAYGTRAYARSRLLPAENFGPVLFCSLAVLDPRVGHTVDVDVLSPCVPVVCHSD